jgi:CubicO group peptidase (beta-lactamase class C family)
MRYAVILLFATCIGCSSPEPASIKTSNGKIISAGEMDKFLEKQLDTLHLPALSVAFFNDGKIVYHRTLGVSAVGGKKADDESVFEACSLSKPVFASLAMKMVEEGKLDLDKPLYLYLPFPEIAYDERYKLITARMVLDHTTGFPNWRWYDKAPDSMHIKEGGMYMLAQPGTFGYSGEAYHWLGKVVAHINGLSLKNLDSLFQQKIAAPIGMKHSYYSWHPYIGQHKVTGYQQGKVFGKYWPAADVSEDSTIFGPASTLHTNAQQYATFLIALLDGKVLKKETVDTMLKQQSFLPKEWEPYWGEIKGWSLGFAVEPTDHGTRYSHGGDNGGFQAGCMFYRNSNSGYVFFTNCDNSGPFYVNLRTFLGEMIPHNSSTH